MSNKTSMENINGVTIRLTNMDGTYSRIHIDVDNLTLLDMEPGKYMLTSQEILEGYEVDKVIDTINLYVYRKVIVEYIDGEE